MLEDIQALDPQGMLQDIQALPQQLEQAWALGQTLPLPENARRPKMVILAGMGGSAIGGDLVAAWAARHTNVPILVWRDYHLPLWAEGPETLVVASSHSGNTEETISAFQAGLEQGCTVVAITRGGQLGRLAEEHGVPLWRFEHGGQPRAAVGFGFALPLALLARLDVLGRNPEDDLKETVAAMRAQQAHLEPEVPTSRNPARRLAGQLQERLVVVFGSEHLAPVARRWKTQINEIAKAWAQFEFLPEADHNTLAGLFHPELLLSGTMHIFLDASSLSQRQRKRLHLTRQAFMENGLNTDLIEARGSSAMAHQWTLLHFGDYVSYYLALLYREDPTPVTIIETFKRRMAE